MCYDVLRFSQVTLSSPVQASDRNTPTPYHGRRIILCLGPASCGPLSGPVIKSRDTIRINMPAPHCRRRVSYAKLINDNTWCLARFISAGQLGSVQWVVWRWKDGRTGARAYWPAWSNVTRHLSQVSHRPRPTRESPAASDLQSSQCPIALPEVPSTGDSGNVSPVCCR